MLATKAEKILTSELVVHVFTLERQNRTEVIEDLLISIDNGDTIL